MFFLSSIPSKAKFSWCALIILQRSAAQTLAADFPASTAASACLLEKSSPRLRWAPPPWRPLVFAHSATPAPIVSRD
jgi:hypothetical protein